MQFERVLIGVSHFTTNNVVGIPINTDRSIQDIRAYPHFGLRLVKCSKVSR